MIERFYIDALKHLHGADVIPAQLSTGGEIQELQLAKAGLTFEEVVSANRNDVHIGAVVIPLLFLCTKFAERFAPGPRVGKNRSSLSSKEARIRAMLPYAI
jgi:hypothetical protein